MIDKVLPAMVALGIALGAGMVGYGELKQSQRDDRERISRLEHEREDLDTRTATALDKMRGDLEDAKRNIARICAVTPKCKEKE